VNNNCDRCRTEILIKSKTQQGWRKVLGIGQAKPMKYQGQILTFVTEGQDEVEVSMCRFTCNV